MSLITCDNLSIGYEGKPIVSNLNFSVENGDCLYILGENGAGKSTFLRTLLHLQPSLNGEIIFDDEIKMNEIGYLPQQTDVQRDFPASVKEIVLSGCQGRSGLRPFYNREEKLLAEENLRKVDMDNFSKRSYRELSGGQQQRVLLARALCAARKLLILDEPVAGLDPVATSEIYDLVYRLNKDDGITVIMISHDLPAAIRYASHILHLGNDWFYGTKSEYMQSDIGSRYLSSMEVNDDA